MLLLLYLYRVEDVFNEIDDFAQRLPLAKESTQHGKKTYEVGKKVFFLINREKTTVLVRVTPKKEAIYLAKTGFFKPDFEDNGSAWLGIDLSIRKDLRLLKELVIDSFHSVANKKAREKLYTQYPI